MISNFIWLMNLVRTKILEGLILPELNISYWEFCIYLAVVGVVATVLINSVRVGGGAAASSARKREAENYDNYKKRRQRQEEYSKRYENGD